MVQCSPDYVDRHNGEFGFPSIFLTGGMGSEGKIKEEKFLPSLPSESG
jgi:hypothetical protein